MRLPPYVATWPLTSASIQSISARSPSTVSSQSPTVGGDVFALHGRGIISSHLDSQGMLSGDLPVAQSLAAGVSAANASTANLTDPVGILGAGT